MPEKKRVELWKKPKVNTVLEGFPGFGLVSTIATGFLIDHLKCEQIGKYWFEDAQPTLAIHNCKAVDPIGIYHNKKYNLVIVHSVTPIPPGLEWEAANVVLDVAKAVGAKNIVTSEGVGSPDGKGSRGFFYSTSPQQRKKFEKLGIDCLGEGIIVGVTSALLLKAATAGVQVSCLFAETNSKLPDSKAAAKIVELLDAYLGLKVDPRPLLKQAEEFEKKIRGMMDKAQEVKTMKEQKDISYVG